MIDYKSLGRRICYYRKQKGLTQAAFSELLDVSESYISQIERGISKVSLTRLDKIADVLEVDIALLISDHVINTSAEFNSEIYEITKNWSKENIDMLINLLMCADEKIKNRNNK